jgi:hypothetical protein
MIELMAFYSLDWDEGGGQVACDSRSGHHPEGAVGEGSPMPGLPTGADQDGRQADRPFLWYSHIFSSKLRAPLFTDIILSNLTLYV